PARRAAGRSGRCCACTSRGRGWRSRCGCFSIAWRICCGFWRGWVEEDPGGAPGAAAGAGGVLEVPDFGEAAEEGVDAFAQGAAAFAMDHADREDAVLQALGEVFREQFADLGGAEGVKVELVGDRLPMEFVVHG